MNAPTDISRRSLRRAVEPHISGPTRGPYRDGHRGHAVRLDSAVDNAQILEGEAHMPEMRLFLGERDTAHGDAPAKGINYIYKDISFKCRTRLGHVFLLIIFFIFFILKFAISHDGLSGRKKLCQGGLFLDKPTSALVRVVYQFALSTGNGAGRARLHYGTLPRDAHVHHERAAKERHEGGRSPAGNGPLTRKGFPSFFWNATISFLFSQSKRELWIIQWFCTIWITGKTGSHNRIENENERGTSELGQSFQTIAGSEKGKSDGFLLRAPPIGADFTIQVRPIRIQFQQRVVLNINVPYCTKTIILIDEIKSLCWHRLLMHRCTYRDIILFSSWPEPLRASSKLQVKRRGLDFASHSFSSAPTCTKFAVYYFFNMTHYLLTSFVFHFFYCTNRLGDASIYKRKNF